MKPQHVLAVLALVATLATLPSFSAITLTPDSANYLSTAENLARHGTFVNFVGKVELIHPPGYSVAMAPFVLLGIPVQWAAKLVNWLSVMLVGLSAWLLLRFRIWPARDDTWALVGAALVMLCPPLLTFANSALSEAMFCGLAMLFFWLCLEADRSWRRLLATSLCGVALCLTRYPGVALILGCCICLPKWKNRAVVLLPSLAVFALLGFASGAARPYLLSSNLDAAMAVNTVSVTISLVVGIFGFFWAVSRIVPVWRQSRFVRMASATGLLYLVGIYITSMIAKANPTLDSRLLIPPALLLTILAAHAALNSREHKSSRPLLLVGIFLSLVAISVQPDGWLGMWRDSAKLLNSDRLGKSTLMQMIREIPDSVPVYSNAPHLVWMQTGRLTYSPMIVECVDNSTPGVDIEQPGKTGGVMVWFNNLGRRYAGPKPYFDIMDKLPNGRVNGYEDSIGVMVTVHKRESVP